MRVGDVINGGFETFGGVLCWLNVRRLLKDRHISGVDWRVSGFFSAWGVWNLWYYPSIEQWCSFSGGVLLVLANLTWVWLALHYMKQQKPVKLERRYTGTGFFARVWGDDWRRYKRYESEAQALQAHMDLLKSRHHNDFEWRIVSPLGTIPIPHPRPASRGRVVEIG